MQFKTHEFDEVKHDMFSALSVKQPYAGQIAYGEKTIEVRSKTTAFRGDLLICSSKKPNIPGLECGFALAIVELYDVKPVEEFTPEDWEQTCIPKEIRGNYSNCWGWMLRDNRRVIEWPVSGQLGIWKLVFTKDLIIEYPSIISLDKESYRHIMNEVNKKK